MSLHKSLAVRTNNPLKFRALISIFAVALLGLFQSGCSAAPITIAANGQSTFSIVVPKVAAQSVNNAAIEMQRDIEEATGAKLPIVKDDVPISGAFISLGSTKQAQAAKVTLQGVKEEGYRIATKEGNLYIIGIDTTTTDLNWPPGKIGDDEFNVVLHPEIPGPALTANGGFSYGTANGVYSFLEDYLGVRWLMPGDIGRDVPKKSTFTVGEINLTHAPMFNYRLMPYVWDKNFPAWQDHMKLGYSFRLNHNHAWSDVVPPSMYKEHPEWFAMDASGKRPAPQGKNYKLETTNPELVKFYAEKAIEAFKAHPELNTFSLTPTDGIGYSQSPESKALYDKEHGTNIGPSVTPLILKFYQDVSAIVAKEYPQGKTTGIFYQLYLDPPSDGSAKFPENFVPVLVSVGSYNNFYKPSSRDTDANMLKEWGKIAPPDWYYYVAPTWLRNSESMVTPAMPENINFIFREMVKNHIKGVYYYGNRNWSQVALSNYIGAKMLWNPQADAVAIQRDWLTRAYGPKAGAVMEEFYNKMDESWFSDYYRQSDSTGNATSEAFFSRIYGKHYREMEELILIAEAQPMTDIQKERLRLISDNMRMLQWRLRSAGYLPEEYSSPYTINTQQVFALKSDSDDSRGIVKAGGAPTNGTAVAPVKIELGQPKQESAAKIPNPAHILLYPTKSGKVQLKPTNVNAGSSFLYYFVQDEKGKLITSGLLDNKAEITFEAKANSPYYFQTAITGVSLNPQDKWEVAVPGAVPAQAAFEDGVLYLKAPAENQDRSLYVYVPEGLNRVAANTETGTVIQAQSSDRQKSQELRYAGIAARAALATALEKYQASPVQNLDSGWKFSPDPEQKGVKDEFFKTDSNDTAWKTVLAIGSWHAHGFPDYYGTAWYRKNFTISMADFDTAQLQNKKLLLFVGAVDGDAVFYLNGQKIAERNQRDYADSWQVPFALDVTSKLQVGRNILAVQVTKDRRAAGLYKGVSLIAGVLPEK
jgi:hypothetical protein